MKRGGDGHAAVFADGVAIEDPRDDAALRALAG